MAIIERGLCIVGALMIFAYMSSFCVFSGVDGVDEKGEGYVLKVKGRIVALDKAESDSLFSMITKYGTLVDARKSDIVQDRDRQGNFISHSMYRVKMRPARKLFLVR